MSSTIKEFSEHDFLVLYDLFSDSIFKLCFFKTSDYETARDITQDVFIRFWDSVQKGGVPVNSRAFLFTIARNLIKDYYKKRKSIPASSIVNSEGETLDLDTYTTTFVDTESVAEISQLTKIFQYLNDEERELITLKHIKEYSLEEIADMCSMRYNTVSVKLHRAEKKLKSLLQDTYE